MEINTRKEKQVLVVSVKGRLDAVNAPEFEKSISTSVEKGVNMRDVDYVSSAGLRSILVLMKKLQPLQGHFILFALQDQIMEVFNISGFSSIIKIVATEQEALGQI
jgi:anti-anti-sigma factor